MVLKQFFLKRTILFIFALLSIVALLAIAPMEVNADAKGEACRAIGGTIGGGGNCNTGGATLGSIFESIINILSVIIGVAAVIMIMIGGFKYVTSGGDANGTKSARDTVLYAVIGLVIVGVAQAIVHLVVNRL